MAHTKLKKAGSSMKEIRDKFAAFKPFDKMVKDGDVCDVTRAAELTGYSEQHIRRLCADKATPHQERRGTYWFTPEDIEALRPKPVDPKA